VTTLAKDHHRDDDPAVESRPATSRRSRLRAGLLSLRARLLTPAEGPEIVPQERPPLPDPHWLGPVRRHVVLAMAALAGLIGGLSIVTTAPVWRMAAPSWRLTLPGVPHPGTPTFNTTAFVVGLILMGLGWMGLIGRASRQRGSERRRLALVGAVFALWTVPFLLGPILLSNDAYSYVAQGELASRGIDPSAHGPVYLMNGQLMWGADSIWRNSPAPYGPVWIQLSKAVVEVSGHDGTAAVWGFRGLAVAGVAMAAVGVALIARSYRLSPAVAVAIGLANPLVLLHLVGGAHNDSFMLGLLALGLAAFRYDRRFLAVVLVVLATAVKLPAVLALVLIGWNWRPIAGWRQRVTSTAAVTAAGAGLVAVLTAIAGMGPGWLMALEGTNKVTSTYSVTTKLGFVSHDLLSMVGVSLDENLVISLFRFAGLLVAAGVVALLTIHSPRIGMVRAVGLGALAVIMLGPVVWPWYTPVGFALLAAVGLGRYRPAYLVLAFAVTFTVFPTSVEPVVRVGRLEHVAMLALVVLVAFLAVGAQWFARWAHERRRRKLGLDLHDELDEVGAGPLTGSPPQPIGTGSA
jgi:alpha-1,6-mannosyltransferase